MIEDGPEALLQGLSKSCSSKNQEKLHLRVQFLVVYISLVFQIPNVRIGVFINPQTPGDLLAFRVRKKISRH